MLALLVSLVAMQAASAYAAQAPIVVRGVPLPELRARVARCEARGCGPFDYANDVLAAANAAFVGGDYRSARSLLDAAVRHLDKADAPAKAKAAIFEAQSVVAEHEGDARDAAGAYSRAVYALHGAGPSARKDEVLARLDMGDVLTRQHHLAEARHAYDAAAGIAKETGSADYAAAVEIHKAVFDLRNDASSQAVRRLRAIVASSAVSADVRFQAELLVARIARLSGDMAPTDALLARLTHQPRGAEPELLYAPPLDDPTPAFTDGVSEARQPIVPLVATDRENGEWADIGYWIRPSGRVDDVEILRGSKGRGWLPPVVANVSKRVYTPVAETTALEGRYAVERFSLGFPVVTPPGTNIPRRAGVGTITELPLTAGDMPPPPAR